MHGVSKTFGGIAAVSGVSLSVQKGESVGLVGPNGAGKTTFFNCVGGQLRPEQGRVELGGVDLLDLPTYQRARLGIGRTYQRIEVFPDMTVWDHLLVAVRARFCTGRIWKDLFNRSAPTAEEKERVSTVLELVGIERQADTIVSTLGLGSCRLVELARALVAEPQLLMADEPSSGLDIQETRELSNVLRMLQRERGMAMLLVEHDLGMVGEVVDRTVVMNLGVVIADGTFDEVMADPVRSPRVPRDHGMTGPAAQPTVGGTAVAAGADPVGPRPSRSSGSAPATDLTAPCSTSRSTCPKAVSPP